MTTKTKTPKPKAPETITPPPVENGDYSKKKTVCPVTKREFQENAHPIEVTIQGVTYYAQVKVFATGSLGWMLTDKVKVKLQVPDKGEVTVTCQTGLNMIIANSKEAPAE